MDVKLEIDPALANSLMEIARHDAICTEFPLAFHVKQRLKERAETRWVHAVVQRENIPFSARDVAQALESKRPPRRFKDAALAVRRLGGLFKQVRSIGRYPATEGIGPGLIEQFHKLMDPESSDSARYRLVPRRPFFLGGVPELVPREELPQAVERVFTWLSESPIGRSTILGVAVAHQELMLLTPFRDYTPAVVDAATRCLLMQRMVNWEGLAVLEQNFASDMNEYEFNLHDRSEAGRQRWVRYFVSQLSAALRGAAREVLELRQHLEREPWLDAAPLSEREQVVYEHVLSARKATSKQVQRALGKRATNLRMVQRDLARLAKVGLIEKVGGRKDAYYRPIGNLEDENPVQPTRRAGTRPEHGMMSSKTSSARKPGSLSSSARTRWLGRASPRCARSSTPYPHRRPHRCRCASRSRRTARFRSRPPIK